MDKVLSLSRHFEVEPEKIEEAIALTQKMIKGVSLSDIYDCVMAKVSKNSKAVYILYYVDWNDSKRKNPTKDILGVFSSRAKAKAVAKMEEVEEQYGTKLDDDESFDSSFFIVKRTIDEIDDLFS